MSESDRFSYEFRELQFEIQKVGLLLFNGSVNVDLIFSEIEANFSEYISSSETDESLDFDREAYLNNDGKLFFARAYLAFSSAYAKAEAGNFSYALSLISKSNFLIGRALQYHQSVTVTASKKQDKSKLESKNRIERWRNWYIENKNDYPNKTSAVCEIIILLTKENENKPDKEKVKISSRKQINDVWLKDI